MKKNFDTPLLDIINGVPIQTGGVPHLLTRAIAEALLNPLRDEDATGPKKAERFALAVKVLAGGEQDYSAEELTLIKDRVGVACTALAVGQIYAAVDA